MPNESELRAEIGHVLLIDIVGYSKLLINQQGELLQTLKQLVQELTVVRSAQDERNLIRLATGDGMALVFRNDLEAPVKCALQLSSALRQHPELLLRMGIHSGPIREILDVNDRANVTGAGIDVAQRVMDCGDAGHILLSKRAADDLAPYPRWNPHLHDLGDTEVKHGVRVHLFNLCTSDSGNPAMPSKLRSRGNGPGPARHSRLPALAFGALLLLSLGAAVWWFASRPTKPAPETGLAQTAAAIAEKSIAVLPFENRSEDKANAYFADGVQDEILTRLSKIADLKVISRTSTQHYKSAPENLPEIARQLGVAHIVEGSVQKSGDAVRVNVQLIRAANDSHLWADTYDRRLTDIFSVESEVAKAIAEQLRAKLTGQEEQVIADKPTNNPQAYDAYLRGLAYTLRTSFAPASTLNAQKYLKEAVTLDPKFARGWALLSYVDASGYITTFLQPTVALREEARQAAETALTLQPDLGEAVLAKGYYHYFCLKDYDTAIRYFEQARPLLSNSSRIPEALAYVARRQGHWDRSEQYFVEAERLDPRDPNLLTQHAYSYIHLRRFPEAQRKLDEILDITPDDVDTIVTKAAIAEVEGDLLRASAILAPLHPAPDNTLALERKVYQKILERRPAPIIPRLQGILAKPDPALGYYNGELRFWLGWAQEVAGDHAAAQESWRQARSELEPFLKEQPQNHFLIGDLALVDMSLGDKTAAFAMVDRCMAVNPVEKDAIAGPRSLEILVRVAAQMEQPDRAIAGIERLLSIPLSGFLDRSMPFTPALLRLDPMFDPLRNDPRFQRLAASSAPNETR